MLTNDHNSDCLLDEEKDFVAFLKDDMVVEIIVLYYTIIRWWWSFCLKMIRWLYYLMIWFWQGRGLRGLLEGWHGSWADSREWRTDIEWADSKKWKTGSRVLPPLSPPFKVLPPLSTIFNLKGSPRVILKNSDGSRMGRWHRTKDWLVVGRLCNAVLQIKRAGIKLTLSWPSAFFC